METKRLVNEEQITLWNGVAGSAWVARQELLDRLLMPFEELLVDAVTRRRAHRVLDVGCVTGSTTVAVARLLGTQGSCLGLDISEPMIIRARDPAEREGLHARFVCADAQTHASERAAAPLLPDLSARRPDEPGRFALADRTRVHAMLENSGWAQTDIKPIDVAAGRSDAGQNPVSRPAVCT